MFYFNFSKSTALILLWLYSILKHYIFYVLQMGYYCTEVSDNENKIMKTFLLFVSFINEGTHLLLYVKASNYDLHSLDFYIHLHDIRFSFLCGRGLISDYCSSCGLKFIFFGWKNLISTLPSIMWSWLARIGHSKVNRRLMKKFLTFRCVGELYKNLSHLPLS